MQTLAAAQKFDYMGSSQTFAEAQQTTPR